MAARAEFFNANSIADRFQKILDFAKSNIALAQETQEYYANQSRAEAPRYKVGDEVWLDTRNIKTERPAKSWMTSTRAPSQKSQDPVALPTLLSLARWSPLLGPWVLQNPIGSFFWMLVPASILVVTRLATKLAT